MRYGFGIIGMVWRESVCIRRNSILDSVSVVSFNIVVIVSMGSFYFSSLVFLLLWVVYVYFDGYRFLMFKVFLMLIY